MRFYSDISRLQTNVYEWIRSRDSIVYANHSSQVFAVRFTAKVFTLGSLVTMDDCMLVGMYSFEEPDQEAWCAANHEKLYTGTENTDYSRAAPLA